jgi:uncharacterized tellurite resistance protein B-like protein
MGYTFTADEMRALSDAQKDAIIDVVIAGVLADGQIADAEADKVDSEFRKLDWGRSVEEMEEKVKQSFTRINAFTSPEQAFGLVKSAAETLADPALREKTFALLMTVMYADRKMSPNEKTVLTVFATAFQLPLPKLAEMAEAVKKGE